MRNWYETNCWRIVKAHGEYRNIDINTGKTKSETAVAGIPNR